MTQNSVVKLYYLCPRNRKLLFVCLSKIQIIFFFLIISDQAEEFDREWGQKTREHRHSPSSLEYQRRRERSDRRREHLAIDGGKRKDKHTYRERD
jgi:hypothetical protein